MHPTTPPPPQPPPPARRRPDPSPARRHLTPPPARCRPARSPTAPSPPGSLPQRSSAAWLHPPAHRGPPFPRHGTVPSTAPLLHLHRGGVHLLYCCATSTGRPRPPAPLLPILQLAAPPVPSQELTTDACLPPSPPQEEAEKVARH